MGCGRYSVRVSLGLTFDKLLIIGLIAVFLIGPDRLPQYAAKLAQLVRSLRDMANGARSRMRDEMGPEFDEIDWRKLDPRQYDPRRIVREALLEDDQPAPAGPPTPAGRRTHTAAAKSGADLDRESADAAADPVAQHAETAAAASTAAAVQGARPRYVESAYEQRLRKQGKGRPAPFDAEST
jgi:sec-independent protein translocase protein TatB